LRPRECIPRCSFLILWVVINSGFLSRRRGASPVSSFLGLAPLFFSVLRSCRFPSSLVSGFFSSDFFDTDSRTTCTDFICPPCPVILRVFRDTLFEDSVFQPVHSSVFFFVFFFLRRGSMFDKTLQCRCTNLFTVYLPPLTVFDFRLQHLPQSSLTYPMCLFLCF